MVSNAEGKLKVLFLSANPGDMKYLRVDDEFKAVRDSLTSRIPKDRLEISLNPKTAVNEIIDLISSEKPSIIHFAGHGTEGSKLIFAGEKNEYELAPSFEKLFEIFAKGNKDSRKLVFLNACYSEDHAKKISKYIDCVIGTTLAIEDDDAMHFAESFYHYLGNNDSIQTAFEYASLNLKWETDKQEQILKIYPKEGVDLSKIFIKDFYDLEEKSELMGTVDYLKILRKYFTKEFDLTLLCSRMTDKKYGLDELSLDLAEIKGEDVPRMLFNIIKYCYARGKIGALISAAIEERPMVRELLELARKSNGAHNW